MLESITNFLQIDPRLATAGQPSREQLAEVAAEGYELVINLLPQSEILPDEEQAVRTLGMAYLHIPVIWDAPTRENLDQFFAALDENRPRKVFVHCMMNMRVAAFVFLYRVLREGVPVEEAREIVRKVWEPNPTWAKFMEQQLDRG